MAPIPRPTARVPTFQFANKMQSLPILVGYKIAPSTRNCLLLQREERSLSLSSGRRQVQCEFPELWKFDAPASVSGSRLLFVRDERLVIVQSFPFK